MKQFRGLVFSFLLLFSTQLSAQLEKIIVENYYISDANDSTNTIGGRLEMGSTTYRIYVDMKPGYMLKKVYGDANHTFKISSTKPFYNNSDRDVSFGKDLSADYLVENVVALDTWLTFGEVAYGTSTNYHGVLKTQDSTGSIVGGINNDGGNKHISGGLLKNTDPLAGAPLTTSDGLDTSTYSAPSQIDFGMFAYIGATDSTIFGATIPGTQFVSKKTVDGSGISCNGVMGVNKETNQVLIAQLTTKGVLSFELNLEISDTTGATIYKYVANDSILLPDEKLSRYLKFTNGNFDLICGCPNPYFIEYNSDRDCDNTDSCKKAVLFGCMDPFACNYDPNANFSIPELCCYPGSCQDRDPGTVCQVIPLGIDDNEMDLEFNIFPNPAEDQLTIQILHVTNKVSKYELYDSFGRLIATKKMNLQSNDIIEQVDVSNLEPGLYLIKLFVDNVFRTEKFIKN